MKWMFIVILFFVVLLPSCAMREREQRLQQRTVALNQKEQELLLKEKSLQLKESELSQKEKLLDSTLSAYHLTDSLLTMDSLLIGKWDVKMRCVETSCPGSAVGDVKTETWDIAFQDHSVIAKAIDGGKLARVYTGHFRENGIVLTDHPEVQTNDAASKIIVTLQLPSDGLVNGRREIIRADNCKTVYDLELRKQ